MAVYEWGKSLRTTGRSVVLNTKLDAQVVGDELDKIREKQGGAFKVEDVLSEAKEEANPLHGAFEWNDTIAGERYRLEQARYLVRCLVVRVDTGQGEPEATRAYVKIKSDDAGNGMTSLEVAMQDSEDRDYVLQSALNSLRSWRRRWATLSRYAELHPIVEHIDLAIEELRAVSAGSK